MKKVLHIITGLESGGAEKNLFNLVINDKLNDHYIFSLSDYGKYIKIIKKNKIKVKIFQFNVFNFLYKFFKISNDINKIRPDLIITWLYHADFVGGLLGKVNRVKRIYWNIRSSTLSKQSTKFSTNVLRIVLSKLSKLIPNKIIYCAISAKNIHKKIGYANKSVHIPNGIDVKVFKPNKKKIDNKSCFKIGYLARWDPQKNFNLAFHAIRLLKEEHFKFKLILAGEKINKKNYKLKSMIKFYQLEDYVVLLGEVKNMPNLYNSLDLSIMTSSYGEAFPNVLAESMSCGVPCVSTNIGDASYIIGSKGWICKKFNPHEFKLYLIKAIRLRNENLTKWVKLKNDCRKRVEDNFTLNSMIKNYQNLIKK